MLRKKQGVNCLCAVAAAQLLTGRPVAQQARHAGQRHEVIDACGLGRQQNADQVDRLFVDGVEVDGRLEPGKERVEPVQVGQLAVGDRDTVADPGRAQSLALDQDLEYRPLRLRGHFGGALGQFPQRLLLAGHAQVGDDAARANQIGHFHV